MSNPVDAQYQELLQAILDYGVIKKDRTGTGTKSMFGYTFRHNMSWGFPLLTTKKMAWKTMVTELLWFLRGDTNIKYLVDNDCHIWNGDAYKGYEKQCEIHEVEPMSKEAFISAIKLSDSKESHFIPNVTGYKLGDLGPIYAKQWRSWEVDTSYLGNDEWTEGKDIDQIANLINDLKTNPDSRRLMVSAWNVGELDQMVLPPCHYGFQVYTRELSLEERRKEMESMEVDSVTINMFFNKTLDLPRQVMYEKEIPTRAISLMWNQRSVDAFLGR